MLLATSLLAPAPQATAQSTESTWIEPAARPRAHRFDLDVMIGGVAIFAAAYLLNGLVSLPAGSGGLGEPGPAPRTRMDQWDSFRGTAFIPLVGPWIQLAQKPTSFDEDLWGPWLVTWGALQVGGATLLGIGIGLAETRDPSLVVLPDVGEGRAGLLVNGRF
jgi:hypothetical protein